MITKEEYLKILKRVFPNWVKGTEDLCEGVACRDCPFCGVCPHDGVDIVQAYDIFTEVIKWDKEHPVPTRANIYKKTFGVEPKNQNSGHYICPVNAGFWTHCPNLDLLPEQDRISCVDCSYGFWEEEIEE